MRKSTTGALRGRSVIAELVSPHLAGRVNFQEIIQRSLKDNRFIENKF